MTTENTLSPEDTELLYTRDIRRRIVDKLTENNSVPTEAKDIAALAGVLSDIDRQAINIKKIKADEQTSRTNGEAAAVVAQLLLQLNGNNMASQVSVERATTPALPAGLAPPVIVDGLTDMDSGSDTYAQFSKRMESKEENQ